MSAASPCRGSLSSWFTIRRVRCENPLWMLYVATVKRMGTGEGNGMLALMLAAFALVRACRVIAQAGRGCPWRRRACKVAMPQATKGATEPERPSLPPIIKPSEGDIDEAPNHYPGGRCRAPGARLRCEHRDGAARPPAAEQGQV